MLGAALHILVADAFPDLSRVGDEIHTKQQLALPGSEEGDGPITRLEMAGRAEHPSFDRLLCHHEEVRPVDARWRRYEVADLTFRHRFTVFRHREQRNLLFAKGKRQTVNAAIRALKPAGVDAAHEPVDVHAFLTAQKEHGATMHAAYFSDLAIRKVTAATLYGEDVDQSDYFDRLGSAGTLSAIMIEARVGSVYEKFVITRRRTVVVYKDMEEKDLLAFTLAVNELINSVLAKAKGRRGA